MQLYEAMVECYWQGKIEEYRENPVPMPLSPTQIAHRLVWESNPISAVTSHCLSETW
jgi:hypothetical protein